MFNKIIHINRIEDIRYGTTKIRFQKSQAEIMALLKKHGCEETAVITKGNECKIGFIYEGKPYMLDIPQVYVKKVYVDWIGIRIVKYYLEILLELSKQRVVNFDDAMLGTRMVEMNGKKFTLREVVDTMPMPRLTDGFHSQPQEEGVK